MIAKEDLNKLMVLLIKRKSPKEILMTDQHWITIIDGYFCCILCKSKLDIYPYDAYLDPKISYNHAITHIKEHNLLVLL